MDLNINIKLDPASLDRLEILIKNLFTGTASQPAPVKQVNQPEVKAMTRVPETKTTVKVSETKASVPASQPAPEAKAPTGGSKITIESLRTLLNEKVTNNREVIRAKLAELSAKNISTLDPANYQVMHDFLNSLKNG